MNRKYTCFPDSNVFKDESDFKNRQLGGLHLLSTREGGNFSHKRNLDGHSVSDSHSYACLWPLICKSNYMRIQDT